MDICLAISTLLCSSLFKMAIYALPLGLHGILAVLSLLPASRVRMAGRVLGNYRILHRFSEGQRCSKWMAGFDFEINRLSSFEMEVVLRKLGGTYKLAHSTFDYLVFNLSFS